MDIPKYVINQLVWWAKSAKHGYIQVHFKKGRMTHLIRYESTLVTPKTNSQTVDSQVAKPDDGSALSVNADKQGASNV